MPGRSKPPTVPDDEGENDRPTVVPPFDVEEMARQSRASHPAAHEAEENETPTVVPPQNPEVRGRVITMVDEAELEVARQKSMRQSSLPPARALSPMPGRTTAPPGTRERPGEDPVIEVGDDDEGLDPLEEARLLLDAGDEAGALALVDLLLRRTPSNAPARKIAEDCERSLTSKLVAKLGSLSRIPRLAVSVDQLVSLALDHRAGFLISFVDGSSTLATILDMSGMAPSEVLGTLVDLKERGVITLR